MSLSVVVIGRNDNYGGRLNERATYCLNTMLDTFDEVVYVDWNSPGKPLTDDIEIKVNPERLKIVVVSEEKTKEILGEAYSTTQKCCEVLARNVGIRRATGDIIVSSNIDIIPPRREYLDILIKEHLNKTFISNGNSYQKLRDLLPVVYGVNSVSHKIINNYLEINKSMLLSFPRDKQLYAAAVICACGDFQIAHKDLWYKVKGFDEKMTKRMYADGVVQYKVLMHGGIVKATTFPPVYHIDHQRNNESYNPIELEDNENSDDWGYAGVDFSLKL
jgi:hypothetical protein